MGNHAGRRQVAPPVRRRLRYPAPCAVCGVALPVGADALWDGVRKTATCGACLDGVSVDGAAGGVAGLSARKEGDRRRGSSAGADESRGSGLVARLRALGSPAVADRGAAWEKGAVGEERLGRALDRLVASGSVAVLHDRGVPDSRANIDHLVVTAAGVWVIDAKNYAGKVEVVGQSLRIDGRDRASKLVSGVHRQAGHVRQALSPTYAEVPVHEALCFVAGGRVRASGRGVIDDVVIGPPKDILRHLDNAGPWDDRWRNAIQHHLARRFRPAATPPP
jgi:hypothetical protein